jgi:hypothetical protein
VNLGQRWLSSLQFEEEEMSTCQLAKRTRLPNSSSVLEEMVGLGLFKNVG